MTFRGKLILFISLTSITLYFSCSNSGNDKKIVVKTVKESVSALSGMGLEKLSEYDFFEGRLVDLIPRQDVIPYDLNTPLFSDYAEKARFVKLPEGKSATYNEFSAFNFPLGTVLIKNFFYHNDFTDETKGRKILETRLLIHEENGWKALPYIWNNEQTEAFLEVAGGNKNVTWVHYDGTEKHLSYSIPNVNQCKGCHVKGSKMMPIGPTARYLNMEFNYEDGIENQLLKWKQLGILTQLPENLTDCPKVPVWDEPQSGSLEKRARAYLEINCAHCHSAEGPANTSGLMLDYFHNNAAQLGIYKAPIAAGRGSGNLRYSIVPGKPEESIMVFRMKSDDPGVMMPELGRKLAHQEGIQLVADWIASLDPNDF